MYTADRFDKDITKTISKLKPEQVDDLNLIFEDDFESSEGVDSSVEVTVPIEATEEAIQSPGVDVMDREEVLPEENDPEGNSMAGEIPGVPDGTGPGCNPEEAGTLKNPDELNNLFSDDLTEIAKDFEAKKIAWHKAQKKRSMKRTAKDGLEQVGSMLYDLQSNVQCLKDIDEIPIGKTTKYPEINLSFTPKENVGEDTGSGEKEDILYVDGDVKKEVTVIHAPDDAMFLSDDLRYSIEKRLKGSLGKSLLKELVTSLSKDTGFSIKEITGHEEYLDSTPYLDDQYGAIEWGPMDLMPFYDIFFTTKGHEFVKNAEYDYSMAEFKKEMGTSEEAIAPDLKIKGETVVMTGNPPKGYKKKDIAKILKDRHGVKAVEPRFTARTTIVIYNEDQLETKKLKAALKSGLRVLPYKQLELP